MARSWVHEALNSGAWRTYPTWGQLILAALQGVLGSRSVGDSVPPPFVVRLFGLFLAILFLVSMRRRYRRGSAGGKLQ